MTLEYPANSPGYPARKQTLPAESIGGLFVAPLVWHRLVAV